MFDRAFAKAHKLAADHRARLNARGPHVDTGVFAKKSDTRGELYIYEGIGASFWGGGVTAKDITDQLAKLSGVKTLDIFINSEGGDVFEGKAIYASLRRFEAQKTVHVDGIAASAASFIAMAGDKIITSESATWMIHEASGFAMGNAGDLRALADVLDLENKAIAGIYAARTGKPAGDFWARAALDAPASGFMATDTWLSAEQALELKLTDEVEKNAAPQDNFDDEQLAAKIPALRIAAETQARIAAARKPALVLAEMEQSLLNDRRRAVPATQRPAARK